MRKYLAKKIVALGVWLSHEAGKTPEAEGYMAGKIALGLSISHSDIYQYQQKSGKSWENCIKDLIKARKARIRIEICKKIDKLIEYKTTRRKEDIAVTGDVKVYIPNGKKV